jgi:hypothetical protein
LKEPQLATPVAFIIFNRPETTARVFAEIAKARPAKLLLIADGPRADHPEDAAKCAATRAVVQRVDWPCEVLTNFSEANLGCKARPVSGLNWVFENVSEAIILEDDCLPHPTFFPFCEELLERYRNNERIMAVSGNNFQRGKLRSENSYYFSRYTNSWGWASWRRAWSHFDIEMKRWPELRGTSWLREVLGDSAAAKYWHGLFDKLIAGEMAGVWDYQWNFSCWAKDGLSITPEVNLVSNIGFGSDSTHTDDASSSIANMPTFPMKFPLRHPEHVVRNYAADQFLSSIYLEQGGVGNTGLYQRLRQKLNSLSLR